MDEDCTCGAIEPRSPVRYAEPERRGEITYLILDGVSVTLQRDGDALEVFVDTASAREGQALTLNLDDAVQNLGD